MNKRLLFVVTSLLLTPMMLACEPSEEIVERDETMVYVNFFTNYSKQSFSLSSGYSGRGNNLLYMSFDVEKGSKVTKPTDPTRKNYEFVSWCLDEEGTNPFDFDTVINANTYLYAKWTLVSEEEVSEPPYTAPSVIDDSISDIMEVPSVMNFKVNNNAVSMPKGAINRLLASSSDVKDLLDYKIKTGTVIDSATYASNIIAISAHNGATTFTKNILVSDNTLSLAVDNSTYESKAKNYEAVAENKENYHVMLAGSSSMENWSTSTEDLDPIVSYNHGIGGTTIEQWDTKLNARLVYPFKPKMVVYYVGINNVINSKESKELIYSRFESLMNHTHEALPNTKIQYVLMNFIPGYPEYYNVIEYVNSHVLEFASNNPWLTVIDAGEGLYKQNGQPNSAYFLTDGLHMSKAGYVIWGGIIKNSIIEGLSK